MHDWTMQHWWWPRKCRIQEKHQTIWHGLKKADKTWVVHQIHGSEILERFFKSWSTVWILVFSGRERHFEIRRIGRNCSPCRLKFNMVDVSKHTIALERNIFRVCKLISHNIFILMFCNSLEQCKISLGYSCCTRVSRNHFYFQFSPRLSGVNQYDSFYNKSGVMWDQLT